MNASIIKQIILPGGGADFVVFLPAILFFCLLLIVSLLISKLMKNWLMRIPIVKWLNTVSIVGLVIYLFRYEQVLYFDFSIWWWVLYGGALVWLLAILIWRQTRAPQLLEQKRVQTISKKYLPKPRKHRA